MTAGNVGILDFQGFPKLLLFFFVHGVTLYGENIPKNQKKKTQKLSKNLPKKPPKLY